jgi:hypothetical protein
MALLTATGKQLNAMRTPHQKGHSQIILMMTKVAVGIIDYVLGLSAHDLGVESRSKRSHEDLDGQVIVLSIP